ncbi:signal peptide peptidase SppA [Pelovirga terrestris]|uniref:Signal peptide peptidase SppA n=1 Tax=Pelovirga terrestris TaxID=2771352 RepID=A0A8J6QY76_9BACT|nr:signal peptide peptidase SppA [Pelovirga terrestris]MBD1400983.1 signal peptide peptidase SppA [Pelovirga terrestris]
MKKRPFFLATMLIGGIFLFFLLVFVAAGFFRSGTFLPTSSSRIGVLDISGMVSNERLIIKQIDTFRDDKSVKAIVLRIDSPGGAVGPSQEIYHELKKLAQEKPLIVSFGAVAASGGYYLAMAGEWIFANPGTITGSIGVVMSFPDYQELMGKVGIKSEVIKSGPFKDIGSASRNMTDDERYLLQGMIADVHLQFVEAVSDGRHIPVAELAPYVDGRIFTGRQALNFGLIDQLGSFNDAVDHAALRVGIVGKPDLVYPPPERQEFLQRYLNILLKRFGGVDLGFKDTLGPKYLWTGP